MRRMTDLSGLIKSPVLIHEEELTNASSLNIKLDTGVYLIELHGRMYTNSAILKVTEDAFNLSYATMFNAGEAGAAIGYWQYDTVGELLEIYDGVENNITVNGHVDIYKFEKE